MQQQLITSGSGTLDKTGRLTAGLSPLHISPQDTKPSIDLPTAEVYVGGSLASVKFVPMMRARVKRRGGRRSAVVGFSSGARRRLLRKLATIQRKALPIFVTLTYPGEFPKNPEVWKNDLDKFAKRFAREFPYAAFVWKLEPQKRGAPHYHLLIYNIILSVDFKVWLSDAWYESVASGDARHHRAGTNAQRMRSARGVRAYCSKYMAKAIEQVDDDCGIDWKLVGRWWGIVARKNIPWAPKAVSYLTPSAAYRLRRMMRRYSGVRVTQRGHGQHVFVNNDVDWLIACTRLE